MGSNVILVEIGVYIDFLSKSDLNQINKYINK